MNLAQKARLWIPGIPLSRSLAKAAIEEMQSLNGLLSQRIFPSQIFQQFNGGCPIPLKEVA